MKSLLSTTFFIAAFLSIPNCADTSVKKQNSPLPSTPPPSALTLPPEFNDYWHSGKAEICTYDVTQERYGETRQAEQVNVFVTEDFSKNKQVKLDDAAAAGADRVPILKLNAIRRFRTGIYDYSMMQSVFSPLNGEPMLKSTSSVQDWCGHVFSQTNRVNNAYRLRGFSYFESEGDQELQLPLALHEDELWTRLRLDPSAIPTGKVSIIPSAIYARLRHKPIVAQNAEIQMEKGEKESVLRLFYADMPRSLLIHFETGFPFRILGWEEVDGRHVINKGTFKAMRRSAYWSEHDNASAPLRDSLQLRF